MHSNFEFLLYPKIIIKQQNWLNFFSTELPIPSWVVCTSILVSFPAAASLQIVTLATSSFSRKKIGDFFILQPLYTYYYIYVMFCYSMYVEGPYFRKNEKISFNWCRNSYLHSSTMANDEVKMKKQNLLKKILN